MTSRGQRSGGKNFAKQVEFLQFWPTFKSNKNTFPLHYLSRIVAIDSEISQFYDSAKKFISKFWCHVHFIGDDSRLQILGKKLQDLNLLIASYRKFINFYEDRKLTLKLTEWYLTMEVCYLMVIN